MALPVTIISAAGLPGHNPPHRSSDGAFYTVVRASATAIDCYKATDPTDSFTVQDATGNPAAFTAVDFINTHQDGDVIHVVTHDDGIYQYHTFNMATDAWVITDETLLAVSGNSTPTFIWASTTVRSDGDVVVAYAGARDAVMGDRKERVDYARREGGSWTTGIALDAGGDNHYGNPNCHIDHDSDFVHCIWQFQPSAQDPPTTWETQESRSIDPSDNSLSTLVQYSPTTDRATEPILGMPNIIIYEDGATDHINHFGSRRDDGTSLIGFKGRITSDAVDWTFGATFPTLTGDAYHNGDLFVGTLAVESINMHMLYAGGGTNGADQDLYYAVSLDNGDSWAQSEEIDAITVNFIAAKAMNIGYDTILAYLYDDGGVQKYNQKILQRRQPYFPNTQNTLLRM